MAAVQERLSLLLDRSIQQSENALPEADVAALENMTVMGFDHERAHCALVCTQNDINAAIQWLQDHRLESTVQIHNHAMQACKAAAAGLTCSLTRPEPAPITLIIFRQYISLHWNN